MVVFHEAELQAAQSRCEAAEQQLREHRTSTKAHTEESAKKDITLKWTQNKLQAEAAKALELTDQLAKANQKIKEVRLTDSRVCQ